MRRLTFESITLFRSPHRNVLTCFALALFWSFSGSASPPPAGIAPVLAPAGGFSIDGEVLANIPTSRVGDWMLSTNWPGSGGAVLSQTGAPMNPAMTFHLADAYSSGSDQCFAGGFKWLDDPNTWKWTTGKPSSKTDINNGMVHIAGDADGHIWVVVAADRLSTSGDSYIDFEFLQNTLTKSTNGSFRSAGPQGGRTTGDLLLSLAFTGGGKVADFFVWRWLTNGSGFTYVDSTAALPVGRVFAALNSNSVAAPYGAFGSTTYAPNAFAEAAVDLTALLGNFDQCLSVGFKTIMIKTKASAADTATIEDFIDPIQYSLKIGPSADAGTAQTRCSEGDSTAFPLHGLATGGLRAIASTTWSVVNGTATIDSPNSLITTARVSSATATLRLTALQTDGCVETSDVLLTVAPLPACSITGPSLVCPRSTNQFRALAGMNVYSWSVSGNGSISGPTNLQSVTVISGSACAANFTVDLTVVSNQCVSACATDVIVNDTTAPTLTCPIDRVLECPADTRTNATGVAGAQDGCGAVTVSYSDAVTNMCGASKVIARTWTAIDGCGNSVSCIQTITVRDTVKPVLVCPTNVVLECPADVRTNATGVASAQDACSALTLSFLDLTNNNCGGSKVISRTWTAVDDCGNSASCVQTITVRDTLKPVVTCPPDQVLECPADTGTNATGVATAQDACSAVMIHYSDVVTTNCGATRLILRTWTAIDGCSNSASCMQTITVRDTTKPSLTCPPDRVLECPADTSTNATGMATAQDTCSAVTIRYNDLTTNNCGGSKIIARTWTAMDACSNSISCVQLITVRDTLKPSITCPPDLVLECPITDTRTNVTGMATGQDACSAVTIGYSDTVITNCGATRVLTRAWTATDQCGNSISCAQTITVRDTTKPAIACPPDLVLECPADTRTNVTGMPMSQDTCSAVIIGYSDAASTPCGNAKVIARTWTATDACGNSSSCTQTISVRDTVKPNVTCPPNLVLECGADLRTNATGVAVAQDGCSSVTITYSDSSSNNCGGTKILWRLWTATDGCNNSATCVQTITLRDTTPPSLRLPANLVLQCPGDTRTNVTGVPSAVDTCGSVAVSYSDSVSNGCGLTRTVLRLWTAIDQCGNSTNGLQTITVVDTTKPSITCPNISVQCVGDVPAAFADLSAFLAAGGRATDSCSSPLTFSLTSDSGLVGRCPGSVTRVYRVTDVCGNFAECTQTITVDDTIAPVLTCPGSVTVECGVSLDPATLGGATATDNCSTNVLIAHTDAVVQADYNLNFYVADPDTGTGPYSPTYLKFSPASLPCPDSARLTGRALDPLRNAVAYAPSGQLDALTSIGNVPMAFGQIVPFEVVIQVSGGTGPERGTIEFTAFWSTYTTSNNRFGYDTNYMIYCAFVDAADPGLIDPNNNARVESYSSVVINQGTIAEAIQGTFRVSGLDSGDRVVVEIWAVLMSAMPDHTGGTVPAGLVSAQKASLPPVPISIGVQTDSLGNLSKIGSLPPPQEQPPLGPLPPQPPVLPGLTLSVTDRTWTATDDCGNQSTCVQRITVRDTTPPSLTLPANLVLQCPADTSIGHTGIASAQDACGSAAVTYSDSVTNTCAGSKVIARTWTATDQAGNSTNAVQMITVQDTTAPTIVCQPNRTVAAGDVWNFDSPSASDTCLSVTVQVLSTVTNLNSLGSMITRTWEAIDGCGNSNTCQQTITLTNSAPVLRAQLMPQGGVKLSWPLGLSAYQLETCDRFTSTNWTPMSTTPVSTNGMNTIEFMPTLHQNFYRLRKP